MSKKLTKEEFVKRSRVIHGDDYDYSITEYIDIKKKVEITCKLHGVFNQSPDAHLSGKGCNICANLKRGGYISQKDFIDGCIRAHGDRYDYSLVNYTGNHKKIDIICSEHGIFIQEAASHRSGINCPKCSPNRIVSFDVFVLNSNKIHSNKYIYNKDSFSSASEETTIICNNCKKEFTQNASYHMHGSGCTSCVISGFDKSRDAYLYVLESDCGKYIKVGITHSMKQRLPILRRKTPFGFKNSFSYRATGKITHFLEGELHSQMENAKLDEIHGKFDGFTEWFHTPLWEIDKEFIKDVLCYNHN